MLGSQTRRCVGGSWDGVMPTCLGLNQEKDYASKYASKYYRRPALRMSVPAVKVVKLQQKPSSGFKTP